MIFKNKHVFDSSDFSFGVVKIGDYVSQDVIDDVVDCLTMDCYFTECTQPEEPYSFKKDPKSGLIRPVYATFSLVSEELTDNIWMYRGYCFFAETEDVGISSILFFPSKHRKSSKLLL